jgi:transmembrane sensor
MNEDRQNLVVTQAARWYARLHASDCTESDLREFAQWRELSVENAKAYLAAERIASVVSHGVIADERLRTLANAELVKPVSRVGSRASSQWRAAATLLVCVSMGLLVAKYLEAGRDSKIATLNLSNTTKQWQRFELKDGSVMILDAGSDVAVSISKVERRVELRTGRAYFEVVHDISRPFFVNAGSTRTVDLGTRFQVERTLHEVGITLVEGSVDVSGASSDHNWRETLLPGEQLMIDADTNVKQRRSVNASALTSWSHGRLEFNGTPLSEALGEINRYSNSKIRLGDERLGSIPIGGSFVAGGDIDQLVDALVAVLPLRVVHVGANEIVLFQRFESEAP